MPHFASGGMTGSVVWVLVSLALVIGLITLLIRWLSKRSQLMGGARALEQLGGLTLGPNKSIQVIEAAGRIYVVGVGENVTLLDRFPAGKKRTASAASCWRSAMPHPAYRWGNGCAESKARQEKGTALFKLRPMTARKRRSGSRSC